MRASRVIAVTAALSLSMPALAFGTTLLYFVTSDGIVLMADSKRSGKVLDADPTKSKKRTTTAHKTAIVRGRFGVATGLLANADLPLASKTTGRVVRTLRFNFAAVIARVERKAPQNPSVIDIAQLVANEAFAAVAELGEAAMHFGAVTPTNTPANTLVFYFVTGYDGDAAKVYQIQVPVDWTSRKVVSPVVLEAYPARQHHALGFDVALRRDAIEAALTRNGAEAAAVKATAAGELGKLRARNAMTAAEAVRLGVALISVQATQTPDDVGGPVRVVKIPRNGNASTLEY